MGEAVLAFRMPTDARTKMTRKGSFSSWAVHSNVSFMIEKIIDYFAGKWYAFY